MGQSNSKWLNLEQLTHGDASWSETGANLEQLTHGDASWSETGASPSEPLRMLSRSNKRFWTSAILSILSRSIPIFADFASIICPFGIAPLLNGLAMLWWLFSATVLMSSIASCSYLLTVITIEADDYRASTSPAKVKLRGNLVPHGGKRRKRCG